MPQIKGKLQGVPNWHPLEANRVNDIHFLLSLITFQNKLVTDTDKLRRSFLNPFFHCALTYIFGILVYYFVIHNTQRLLYMDLS